MSQKIKISNDQITQISKPQNSNQNPSTSLIKILKHAFLPTGYPETVSDDYLTYQIYDTCQALCSSLNGSLATFAVLKTVGVGDSSATVLSSTLSWLLKDGSGMVSGILFTYCHSRSLDLHSKQWRLVADVLNDLAMMVDIFLIKNPYFLCISAIFRSIVGVAGNSTRMQIILHQASKTGGKNIGDINAKDGAQETFVNLFGLILNFFLVPVITRGESPIRMYLFFSIFTILHVVFNFLAVTSVKSNVLNIYRLGEVLKSGEYDVKVVNDREPIFTCLLYSVRALAKIRRYFTSKIEKTTTIYKINLNSNLSTFTFTNSNHKILSNTEKFIILKIKNFNDQIFVNFKNDWSKCPKTVLKSLIFVNSGFKLEKSEEIFDKIVENGWSVDRHMIDVGEFGVCE